LKDILSNTQKDFFFDNIKGTLVCVYFPDYMDGINAPGWHIHFLSEDRTKGGHVFDLKMIRGSVRLDKIQRIEIQLPREPAFDTYALKSASQDEIKQVEQGK
jgi:acetolactate decarboxylase